MQENKYDRDPMVLRGRDCGGGWVTEQEKAVKELEAWGKKWGKKFRLFSQSGSLMLGPMSQREQPFDSSKWMEVEGISNDGGDADFD